MLQHEYLKSFCADTAKHEQSFANKVVTFCRHFVCQIWPSKPAAQRGEELRGRARRARRREGVQRREREDEERGDHALHTCGRWREWTAVLA